MESTTEKTSSEATPTEGTLDNKPRFFKRPPNPFRKVDVSKSLRGAPAPGRKTKGLEVVHVEIDGERVRALMVPKRGLRKKENIENKTDYDRMALEKAEAKRNRKARRNLELLK
jgi:hypothetical protein